MGVTKLEIVRDPPSNLDAYFEAWFRRDPEAAAQRSFLWGGDCLPARAREHITYEANTAPIRALRAWFDDDGDQQGDGARHRMSGIAIVAGPPGTGKTIAACWLAIHRLSALGAVTFKKAARLAREPRSERDAVVSRANVDAAIIDDIGAESPDAGWLVDFDEIIDAFYEQLGLLVMTTNLTAAQFKRRYGLRVWDRLAEVGEWIPATGASLRAAARKQKAEDK